MDIKKNRKSAFTLAEILITLGIIGVVAAMTMPVLINNYKEVVTVTKVKKFYSLMSQAIQLSYIDNGSPDNWGISTDNEVQIIYEHIKPYLKIIKTCTPANNDADCTVPNNRLLLNGTTWGGDYNNGGRKYYKLLLADGSTMWFRSNKEGEGLENGPDVYALFWLDTNGYKKAPNQMGKDIFVFYLKKKGLVSHAYDDCYLDSAGWGCAKWILEHGNMNYPKKKS